MRQVLTKRTRMHRRQAPKEVAYKGETCRHPQNGAQPEAPNEKGKGRGRKEERREGRRERVRGEDRRGGASSANAATGQATSAETKKRKEEENEKENKEKNWDEEDVDRAKLQAPFHSTSCDSSSNLATSDREIAKNAGKGRRRSREARENAAGRDLHTCPKRLVLFSSGDESRLLCCLDA